MKKDQYKVIVIGAGYAGLRAVEKLRFLTQVSVTLIDKNPYHYLQTEAYGYVAGRFDLGDVALDLQNWTKGFYNKVEFIQDEVVSVDYATQSITTSNNQLNYDYLIVATGASTNFFEFIPGLKEYSVGVKELDRAFEFRSTFEELLYNKITHPNKKEVENINIAIGGAGLSGVEIAAEMADVITKHSKSIGESANQISLYLIDAAPTILPGMSNYIIDNTMERLESLGIHVMTNTFIEKIDENSIYFKGGESLEYRFMVFTGGIKANTVSADAQGEFSRVGQYVTDEFLQIAPNVYGVGDCTELKDKNDKLLPPTAQTAERSAEYIVNAIYKKINNHKIKPFTMKIDGVFVALGGSYAIGEMFGFIRVKGSFAYLLKKLITKTYYLGLKFRLNLGFNKRTKEI